MGQKESKREVWMWRVRGAAEHRVTTKFQAMHVRPRERLGQWMGTESFQGSEWFHTKDLEGS